jgi:hypothetical protein
MQSGVCEVNSLPLTMLIGRSRCVDPKAFEEAMRRPRRLIVRLLGMIVFILLCSLLPLIDFESPTRVNLIALGNLLYGCGIAVIAYTLLMERSASVVFLRDSGVNIDARFIAWSSIREAKRFSNRSNVLRLRYQEADLFVETPMQVRDEIEAFINDQVAAAKREERRLNA